MALDTALFILGINVDAAVASGGDNWILIGGVWSDTGVWVDADVWID